MLAGDDSKFSGWTSPARRSSGRRRRPLPKTSSTEVRSSKLSSTQRPREADRIRGDRCDKRRPVSMKRSVHSGTWLSLDDGSERYTAEDHPAPSDMVDDLDFDAPYIELAAMGADGTVILQVQWPMKEGTYCRSSTASCPTAASPGSVSTSMSRRTGRTTSCSADRTRHLISSRSPRKSVLPSSIGVDVPGAVRRLL